MKRVRPGAVGTPETSVTSASGSAASMAAASPPPLVEAVEVGNAEANAAALSAGERHRLWQKYLRSRGIVKGRDEFKGKRARRVMPVPEGMRAKVDSSPYYYFDLWVKKRGDWGSVELQEVEKEKRTVDEDEELCWMNPEELERALPKGTMEAYVVAAMQAPEGTWYMPNPLLRDELRLAKFKVSRKHFIRIGNHHSHENLKRFTGRLDSNTDQDTAKEVMNAWNVKLDAVTCDDVEKTPAEVAAAEQKKSEETVERKRRLEAKKLLPAFRCKKFIQDIPKEMAGLAAVMRTIKELRSKPYYARLSSAVNLEHYTNLFSSYNSNLRKLRPRLETNLDNPKEGILADAEKELESMKADIKSFNDQIKVYDPQPKGTKRKGSFMDGEDID